jgi:hypothetical protein
MRIVIPKTAIMTTTVAPVPIAIGSRERSLGAGSVPAEEEGAAPVFASVLEEAEGEGGSGGVSS